MWSNNGGIGGAGDKPPLDAEEVKNVIASQNVAGVEKKVQPDLQLVFSAADFTGVSNFVKGLESGSWGRTSGRHKCRPGDCKRVPDINVRKSKASGSANRDNEKVLK